MDALFALFTRGGFFVADNKRSCKQKSLHTFSARILQLLSLLQLQLSALLSRHRAQNCTLFLGAALCLQLHNARALLLLAQIKHTSSYLRIEDCALPSSPCVNAFHTVSLFLNVWSRETVHCVRNDIDRLIKVEPWCTALTRLAHIEEGRPVVYCAKTPAW